MINLVKSSGVEEEEKGIGTLLQRNGEERNRPKVKTGEEIKYLSRCACES